MLSCHRARCLTTSLLTCVLCLASFSSLAGKADDYVAEARGYINKGEIKAAVIELKNALQNDPSHTQARLLLGSLYLRTNDGPAAAKEYGRARDLGAAAADWMPGYARALSLQNEQRAIIDEIQVDDSLPPTVRAELLALRGNAFLARNESTQATKEYDAALAADPGNSSARLGKVQILLRDGNEAEALEHLDVVVRDNPDYVNSRLVRADLLRRLQRPDEALVDYQRAAELAPNDARPFVGLALVNISQGNVDAAKQNLAVLQRVGKGLPAVSYLQALVSFQDRDFDRAADELQSLLRMAPGNLQAQLLYGMVAYARSEFTIADDYLTRVLASAPGNPQVVKLIGAARLKLKQPERAAQVLETVVDDQTADAQLLALLGTALIETGDNSRGSEFIARAVEIDPDQALLRTQLAVGRIASGDTNAAISQLESAVALGQDVIQADVLLVLSYLNKQEYDKAIKASEALEQRMADSPIPFNLTGLAFLAQQRFDEARARFELALRKDPDFLVAQMNLARLALAQGDQPAADAAYDKVLEKDPKHLGALMGKATLAAARNDEAEVERLLLVANNANPTALRPILALSEGYLRRGEPLKAANMMSGLSPEQSEQPAVLRLRGMAQLQGGDYPSATRTFGKLAEVQPESIESWFQLARAQLAAGNADAARTSFKKAIDLDQAHQVPVAWIGLGELELREKQFEAALQVAERLKGAFPGKVYGHDIAAAAYMGLGQADQLVSETRQAFAIDPTSARVNAYAASLTAARRVNDAIGELEKWVAEHPEDASSWSRIGLMRQQLGEDDKALAAYEQVVKHAKPDAVILNNMAWLYLTRNGERASELAKQAYELAPSRAEIVDTYGWVLFKTGQRSEGLNVLQEALVIAPRNAEIALHVAEALIELDRAGEARPLLDRVVREHPNSKFATAAQQLLGRIGS